jgi:probable rRNA maturation factor
MIVNRQRGVNVPLKALEDFFERVRKELRFPQNAVTIQFISDAAMARLNENFRHKRGPTDVLSFPVNDRGKPHRSSSYIGDIAISPQTARRNARRLSRTLPAEMRLLILHGMLHLAGFDHETDRGEMDRLEHRLRRRLGVV